MTRRRANGERTDRGAGRRHRLDRLIEYLAEDSDKALCFRFAEGKEVQVARGSKGIFEPGRVKHGALEDKAVIVRRDA